MKTLASETKSKTSKPGASERKRSQKAKELSIPTQKSIEKKKKAHLPWSVLDTHPDGELIFPCRTYLFAGLAWAAIQNPSSSKGVSFWVLLPEGVCSLLKRVRYPLHFWGHWVILDTSVQQTDRSAIYWIIISRRSTMNKNQKISISHCKARANSVLTWP